jgi:hypothetical protein
MFACRGLIARQADDTDAPSPGACRAPVQGRAVERPMLSLPSVERMRSMIA